MAPYSRTSITRSLAPLVLLHACSLPSAPLQITTALELFYELRNDRQAAASHYQLGSFYSSYWPLCPSRSDALLEKALLHYREAHGYYSKFDVGPTLLLILIDMCDLYLAAYSASEPYLTSANASVRTDRVTPEPRDDSNISNPVAPSLAHSSSISPITATTTASDPPGDPCCVPAEAEVEAAVEGGTASRSDCDSELVVALLGGALQSLLESRFALTPAVALMSKHRSQIISLAAQIATRLGGVLLKVLRAYSKGLLPCIPHTGPLSPCSQLEALSLDSSKGALPDGDDEDCGPVPPSLSLPAVPADRAFPKRIDTEGAVERDGSEMVLEARRICSELLRWPMCPPATASDNTAPCPVPAVPAPDIADRKTAVSIPLKASRGKTKESSTPTHSAAATAVSASVARLYGLIDRVNQNDWLRSCANSKK